MSVRLPLPARVGTNGAYGFVRRTPADGGCGVGSHPCTHYGVDLVASEGARVVSPVDGWVVYAVGAIPPFKGFDPAVCVIEEDSAIETHRFHLLGHLDYYRSRDYFGDNHADGWPRRVRVPVRAGQIVGVVGGYRHVHWQVQSDVYQRNGRTWKDLTTSPLEWASRRGAVYAPPSNYDSTFGLALAAAAAILAG